MKKNILLAALALLSVITIVQNKAQQAEIHALQSELKQHKSDQAAVRTGQPAHARPFVVSKPARPL